MIRPLAMIAIFLNVLAIGAWAILNPPATYERLADRDLRAAHEAYRKVGPEQSYALYRKVAESYAHSTFADEARFFSARTAFMGLGKFDEAEKELTAYLEGKPKNEDHVGEATEYLELINNRSDLPVELKDIVLWEYVQAVVEDSNGRNEQAMKRVEWLVETYKTSAIGQKAEALRQQLVAKTAGGGSR